LLILGGTGTTIEPKSLLEELLGRGTTLATLVTGGNDLLKVGSLASAQLGNENSVQFIL